MAEVLTMPRYETVEAAARSLTARGQIPANRRHGETTPTADRRLTLDRGLELLEQHQLSATELRLLLALLDGETPVPTLAQALRLTETQVRRAGARLYVRNLIRWRDGDDRATVLDVTPAGLATVRPLVAAAGHAAA
jgi:DNA-binding MarR family transcriptional regulator